MYKIAKHMCTCLGKLSLVIHVYMQYNTTMARGRTPRAKSTGQEVQGMEECSLTATEAARLIDWLESHGHTAQDATECIKYIATGTQQSK